MKLLESGEMYLETIYVLKQEKSNVRSIDISLYMGFSKPSVSRAVGLLRDGGYITVDDDGYISLTDEGYEVANKIYKRHNVLTEFLTGIGVSAETAALDACKIEHHISDETFAAIAKYIESK